MPDLHPSHFAEALCGQTPGVLNASVGFDEQTLAPTFELAAGRSGASAGINIAQRLGLNPPIIDAARAQQNTQTQDIAPFLDQLHSQLDADHRGARGVEAPRAGGGAGEEPAGSRGAEGVAGQGPGPGTATAVVTERLYLPDARDGAAIDDRAAQQKLSKEAERRMAKLRREFSEQFNSSVVAQHSGADGETPTPSRTWCAMCPLGTR